MTLVRWVSCVQSFSSDSSILPFSLSTLITIVAAVGFFEFMEERGSSEEWQNVLRWLSSSTSITKTDSTGEKVSGVLLADCDYRLSAPNVSVSLSDANETYSDHDIAHFICLPCTFLGRSNDALHSSNASQEPSLPDRG